MENFRYFHSDNSRTTKYFKNPKIPVPDQNFARWRQFARENVHDYVLWHCAAIASYTGLPVMLIKYEDLMARPIADFTRLLRFVDSSITMKDVLAALRVHPPLGGHSSALRGVPSYLLKSRNFMNRTTKNVLSSPHEYVSWGNHAQNFAPGATGSVYGI